MKDVVAEGEREFIERFAKAENYVADLWNSLGSEVAPDDGTEGIWIN